MKDFYRFIGDIACIDVPCVEGLYTWFNSYGSSISRLDRFLVSDNLIDDWKIMAQYIGRRGISDHFSISLKTNNVDWGPRSFNFNNCWLKHSSFLKFVEVEWKFYVVRGRGDYVLKEKLGLLKASLEKWNVYVFGSEGGRGGSRP
ncbi:unnamed protein product [Lathyrus sativus]|nr:unnamed protein product [Lathyrus sativus]